MNSHDVYARFRQSKEAELEKGIEQPACGCRVVWEWRYTSAHYLPAAACVVSIESCERHAAYGTDRKSVEEQAELIGMSLNERLGTMRARFDAADSREIST